MNWTHISNSGAQATSGSQTSLSATFPGTIAPGDLIVVSVAFFGPYVPTVQDSAHTTALYISWSNPWDNPADRNVVLHSEQWRKQFRGYCHRQWGVLSGDVDRRL